MTEGPHGGGCRGSFGQGLLDKEIVAKWVLGVETLDDHLVYTPMSSIP